MRLVFTHGPGRIGCNSARLNAPWRTLRALRSPLFRQQSTTSPSASTEAPPSRSPDENTDNKVGHESSLARPLEQTEDEGKQHAKPHAADHLNVPKVNMRDPKTHNVLYRRLGIRQPLDPRLDRNPNLEQLLHAKAKFGRGREYRGVNLDSKEGVTQESDFPWVIKPEAWPEKGLDRLAVEIDKFYAYAMPDRSEYRARGSLIKQVRKAFSEVMPPQHALENYGLHKTGMAGPLCDIGLAITTRHPEHKHPVPWARRYRQGRIILTQMLERAQKEGWEYNGQLISSPIPRLDIKHGLSGLYISISLAHDREPKVLATLMRYLEEFPFIRQVHCILQAMLDVRGLSSGWLGGIRPYPLFMMLVASINMRPHPRNDAAGALYNFLDFWKDFDTSKGLSLDAPHVIEKPNDQRYAGLYRREALRKRPSYMLYFPDPIDPTEDLGRQVFAIKHLQATFQHLFTQLAHDIESNDRASLLAPLVGTTYIINRNRRLRLRAYGRMIGLNRGTPMFRICNIETQEQHP